MQVERTVAWLTLRQLFSGRRALAVAALAALPPVVAALFRAGGREDALGFLLQVYGNFSVGVVLPLVALVLGTGAFGAELEDGTAVYSLTRPVARWRIALAKLVTASTLTLVVTALSTALAGAIAVGAGPGRVVVAFTGATALGALLYAAVFVALGLFMRRALIAGFVYVVLWEGVAADSFAGTRSLSIRQYVLSAADRITTLDPTVFQAELPIATTLLMAPIVFSLAAGLTVYRLRAFELTDQR
jgi:ABC-2 type transport system permease protein